MLKLKIGKYNWTTNNGAQTKDRNLYRWGNVHYNREVGQNRVRNCNQRICGSVRCVVLNTVMNEFGRRPQYSKTPDQSMNAQNEKWLDSDRKIRTQGEIPSECHAQQLVRWISEDSIMRLNVLCMQLEAEYSREVCCTIINIVILRTRSLFLLLTFGYITLFSIVKLVLFDTTYSDIEALLFKEVMCASL